MKKSIILLFLLFGSLPIFTLPVLGDRLVQERDGRSLPAPVNKRILGESIKEALEKASVGRVEWNLLLESPGSISTELIVSEGRHSAELNIQFSENGYKFIHISSKNLDENRNGTRIHPNYNEWIENLDEAIYRTYIENISKAIDVNNHERPEIISENRKTVAVMSFKVSENEEENLGEIISDLFSSELVDTQQYNVVTRTSIGSLMEELKFQASDITTEDNAVAIGEMTNADYVVVGTISKLGSLYVLQVHLIDVMTGQIIQGAKETFSNIEEVVDIMAPLVTDLID